MEPNLNIVGKLQNGNYVYGNSLKQWELGYKVIDTKILEEALSRINCDEISFIGGKSISEVDMEKTVGKSECVTVLDSNQTFMAKRKGRNCLSHIVINREPQDCDKITVILEKNNDNKSYNLVSAYFGPKLPLEVDNANLRNIDNYRTNVPGETEEEVQKRMENAIKKSEEFWSKHALLYNRNSIEYVLDTNGKKLSTDEFEEKYLSFTLKNGFDIPNNSIIMLIGVPASGKSSMAKKISLKYPSEILSSDAIRDEIHKKDENQVLFSDTSKEKVYNEILTRVEYNVKKKKRTIVDATFMFESGENARHRIYELSKKYNVPLRAIMLKTPLELSKKLNQQRSRHVDDGIIEEMWNYMEYSRNKIIEELQEVPNSKFKIVETQDLIKDNENEGENR